ncbi:glycosyltransferase family 2 protein [Patescibacteria group bacterium]|nr:glycosyltransferase family 2 protein [Patescibacteria group bacterium]
MDLSIVIVSWNVVDKLRDNIKAIYKYTQNMSFEVFVVDNNSSDGSVEMVQKEFSQVKLIANVENFGFAKANNQAIQKSLGRYVLLLNPDMRVQAKTLENMVSWMDGQIDVGVAGCHLVDENGKTVPHVRKFPNLFDQLMIVLKVPHILPSVLNRYLMKDFDYEKPAQVDSIRGSFFMIRRNLIEKIGMLDERYFIWFEEVDYCKQVSNTEYKVMYTPVATCIDFVGQSFNKIGRAKKQGLFRDSMLKYFKKWHDPLECFVLYMAWSIGILIASVF